MNFKEKFFFLCRIPLDAESSSDVEVVRKSESTTEFPELFKEYEEKRSHAFNEDGLYSVIRAEEIFLLVRTTDPKSAKEIAFEDSRANLITNLEHRVMQNNDAKAKAILSKVHEIELDLQK